MTIEPDPGKTEKTSMGRVRKGLHILVLGFVLHIA